MSLPGDINNDGKVDQQDLKFLRNLLASNQDLLQHLSDDEKALLDINHDGHIDYDDVAAICTKMLNSGADNQHDIRDKLANLRHKLSQ